MIVGSIKTCSLSEIWTFGTIAVVFILEGVSEGVVRLFTNKSCILPVNKELAAPGSV